MAECVVSDANKDLNDSSRQSSDVQCSQDVKTEKVMEPLLVEDFHRNKVPRSLLNLMTSFENHGTEPSKSDFLVGCIYILMLECGFIPKEKESCYADCEFNYKNVIELASFPGWKKVNENSYSLTMILVPHSLYVCNILCIKMGDDFIINSIVKNIEDVHYTFMLDILSYFTDGAYLNADLRRVQNLRHLSTLLKSHIGFPIKHAILNETGVRHPCFEDLPVEVILLIFKYLHGTHIAKFTATCKQFEVMRQEVTFWETLLMRDFGYHVKPPKSRTYDELIKEYGRIYTLERKKKRKQTYRTRLLISQCI